MRWHNLTGLPNAKCFDQTIRQKGILMSEINWSKDPHRRYNPLTDEWILVSPQRADRPWQGQIEDPIPEKRPAYDPKCYLCPGNERAGGAVNPDYTATYVFTNDFSALLPDTPHGTYGQADLLRAEGEKGICRVVCFSPDHSLTIPEMTISDLRGVVDVWTKEYEQLGAKEFINYVQIFQNKGEMMGCSNPHPHGQIWSNETIPQEPATELRTQRRYLQEHDSCMLCDYLALEQELGQRLVCQNNHFVALVPFWAVWPFEILIISRRHLGSLSDLQPAERDGLADILKRMTTRYDNMFKTSFPYTMGLHQTPTDGQQHESWHLHLHFYPPLLRSATVKKFMVGYEMLANPQRDLTAESAAQRLRDLSEKRFDKA